MVRIKKIGIYKITSPSGKIYIGQSWDVYARWRDHKYCSGLFMTKIKSSIKKYGSLEHIFELIHELPKDTDQKILDQFEITYISIYADAGFKMLNIREGGSSGKFNNESKSKMSNWQVGKKLSEETKNKISKSHIDGKFKNPMLGKKHTLDTRDKISKSRTGIKLSQSHKDKVSAFNIKRWNGVGSDDLRKKMSEKMIGRVFSKETKIKMSNASKGRKVSEETRNKLRVMNLGKKQSEEAKNKNRMSNLGRIVSKETKVKMSESAKRRWTNG